MNIIALNQQNFDETITKHETVLIDFWAKWCVPCRSFSQVIEQVAKQYPDIIFGSIDIDEQQELSEEFAIKSVPTILIIRHQVVVFAESGALNASGLVELLEQTQRLSPQQLK